MVIGETRTDLQMRGDSTHSTSQDRKGQIITARVHITLAKVSVVALEAVSPKEDLAIKPSLVIMRLTIGKFQFPLCVYVYASVHLRIETAMCSF